MAQRDILKRYLDAGVAFTQMTQERAEAIVKDLVKDGEIRRKEAQKRVQELIDRSQKNTEELLDIIRREVAEQIRNLGLEDLAKRAGLGGTNDDNPTSVGVNPSPTPNAADDKYPAPSVAVAKEAAKNAAAAAKKTSGTGAKKATKAPAKSTGARKVTKVATAGKATTAAKATKAGKATKATKKT